MSLASPSLVEFAAPRRTYWLGLVGSLAFVALGGFLMIAPGLPRSARLTGLGNALFFGLCTVVYARDVRRPRVALILDSSGLEHRHPDPRQAFRFAWKALAGVRVEDHERGSTVVLTLRDPAQLPGASISDRALDKGAWPPLVPPETTLAPSALGTTSTELADAIERFRRYYGDPGNP